MTEEQIESILNISKNLENVNNEDADVFEQLNAIQQFTSLFNGNSNNTLEVGIKKLHPNAIIPSYSKPGDAGMDITAVSKTIDEDGNIVYGSGLAFEIPNGYVGLLFPRSSNAKKDLFLTNSVGVLDSQYRGEVMFKFKNINNSEKNYEIGDRVAQLIIMPYPSIQFIEKEELTETERGEGGYGSTGK